MLIRSKAPLRLGLAGGGTDLAPYSDLYGGAVLNATLNLYANTTISPRSDKQIKISLVNSAYTITYKSSPVLPVDGLGALVAGVYNRVVSMFTGQPLAFDITVSVDAPPGSGLGSSSTLVVSVLGAFREWLNLPLGEYDIAHLAWEIERVDLGMEGGKQDQYAATFGGVNYMEFNINDKVLVNPLRINPDYLSELSHNTVLYYTGTSRLSSSIISEQVKHVRSDSKPQLEAMHRLKEQALNMKEALLTGDIDRMGRILDFGWQHKKLMAGGITNPEIDSIYDDAIKSGATGGKISGAGGGGYMILYCPGLTRHRVENSLKKYRGRIEPFEFINTGLRTWTIMKK